MKKLLVVLIAAVALAACYKPNFPARVDFTMPNTDGSLWSLEAHKGKPVFIAVMATYCGYCKMSVPMVNELNDKYKEKIEVIGLFANPTPEEVKKYIAEQKVNYPALYNAGSLFEEMGVDGVPHFVLLDKNHMPYKSWGGYSQNHDFEASVDKVIKE